MLSARRTTSLIRYGVAGNGKQTLSGVGSCSDVAGFCSRRLSASRPDRIGVQLERVLADGELRSGWALKEELRMWYQSATPVRRADSRKAERMPRSDCPLGRKLSGVPDSIGAELRTLLSFCRTWRQEILNYFTWPYTNGFVEGKNNRIKAIKRRGYGYRNPDSIGATAGLPQ